MSQRIGDVTLIKQAVPNSAGAIANIAGAEIYAGGFSRARFIFNFSNAASTGSLSTGLGIWNAAGTAGTSNAAYTLITGASAAAVTSGAISGGANNVILLDVPVANGYPWIRISGGWGSTGVPHSAVVELYNGISNPPTHTANQVVVV